MDQMTRPERLHSLDAVRGFALLLGIFFHATISFTPAPIETGWPLIDNSPSDTLSATFFVLHVFRMTVFFVIAGFFARLVVHRKGVQEFVRDRRRRILIPLLVSWPVIMALFAATFAWMFIKTGVPLTPPKMPYRPLIPFAWGHLWFLYLLMLLYVILLGFRRLANSALDRDSGIRRDADAAVATLMKIPVFPVLLGLPLACSLYFTPWWNFWIGIPTPDNSLIPNTPALIGYGTAMLFGWFLHRQSHLLSAMEHSWWIHGTSAIVLTAVAYEMVGMPSAPIKLTATDRAIYCIVYCTAAWCWTFAIIGAAAKFLSSESALRRYLADSSYWMYLMHMPIVFALQILVMDWPLHWSIKYSFILSATFAVLLASYHYWVRPTFVGKTLNGRRYPRNVAVVKR